MESLAGSNPFLVVVIPWLIGGAINLLFPVFAVDMSRRFLHMIFHLDERMPQVFFSVRLARWTGLIAISLALTLFVVSTFYFQTDG